MVKRHGPLAPLFMLVAFPLSVLIGFACSPRSTEAPAAEASPPPIVKPINDGNGIYYFPVTGERYRQSLQAFYADNGNQYLHCDYQGSMEKLVEANIGWASATRHTETIGHILRCHDIAEPAQDITVP